MYPQDTARLDQPDQSKQGSTRVVPCSSWVVVAKSKRLLSQTSAGRPEIKIGASLPQRKLLCAAQVGVRPGWPRWAIHKSAARPGASLLFAPLIRTVIDITALYSRRRALNSHGPLRSILRQNVLCANDLSVSAKHQHSFAIESREFRAS